MTVAEFKLNLVTKMDCLKIEVFFGHITITTIFISHDFLCILVLFPLTTVMPFYTPTTGHLY